MTKVKDAGTLEVLIVGQMPSSPTLWNEWTLRQAIRRAFYYMEHGDFPIEEQGPAERVTQRRVKSSGA